MIKKNDLTRSNIRKTRFLIAFIPIESTNIISKKSKMGLVDGTFI